MTIFPLEMGQIQQLQLQSRGLGPEYLYIKYFPSFSPEKTETI